MDNLPLSFAVLTIAYLIGSIPTAYLVGRLRGINIFEVGSGNMGATNIVRATGRIGWGALVWFFDSSKSVIAVLIGLRLMAHEPIIATILTSVGAMVGHNWSVWVAIITGKLRGGKGAAAAFGTLLVVAPFQVIAGMLIFGGMLIALTRYVSLSVLSMFALAFVWLSVLILQHLFPVEYFAYVLSVTVLLLVRFRDNIERLLAGTERRLGDPA